MSQLSGSSLSAPRSIRLNEGEITAILDGLDEADAARAAAQEPRRYRYRLKTLVIDFRQPDAPSGSLGVVGESRSVPTRWLSATGMGLLSGNYLHVGTRFEAKLITVHGMAEVVRGSVGGCRHVQGCIHDTDVAFAKAIDPVLFCHEAMTYRVLIADGDPLVVRLASHHLKQLNTSVEVADNGRKAVDMALKASFDLILMDLEMPVMGGIEATAILRGKGYTGAIAAFTGASSAAHDYKKLGFDRFLAKPFSADVLTKLLHSLQRPEPTYSRFHNDECMRELVNAFVAELPATVSDIELAGSSGDGARLEVLARRLKESGACYGFDAISEAAQAVEEALAGGASGANQVAAEVDRLCKLCRLTRGTSAKPTAP